jgi:sulfate adenylyltransferase
LWILGQQSESQEPARFLPKKLFFGGQMPNLIAPHGGRLVNRLVEGFEREKLLETSKELKAVRLGIREISDLELIAIGGLSPLEGFQGKSDYQSILRNKRLANGLPWTIPITLSASRDEADGFHEGDQLSLIDAAGEVIAIMDLEEKFQQEREKEAKSIYGTNEQAHPGVAALYKTGDILLAGKVHVLNRPAHHDFQRYRLDPKRSREVFDQKGWRLIVGFQTRNPVHRAHEYIQKVAMETVDGLFLHPLVGETKGDDIPANIRMQCYEVLLERYYPEQRVVLGVNPAAMRYAGPMEAIFHAIIRKNYGCSHFIVGRDHAGVGNYYGTYDAHYIFDEFRPDELGITPMFFDHTFYCKECGNMASKKTCPHDMSHHVILSGTKVRELLRRGETPPVEFTRPEVARVLIAAMQEIIR